MHHLYIREEWPGGILKRSLGMVERAVGFAIPKSCGLEPATLDHPDASRI